MDVETQVDVGQRIVEIVVTGGPAAGKSTALARLVGMLADHGVRALVVSEMATFVHDAGLHDFAHLAKYDYPSYLRVEEQLLLMQLDLEARFRGIAEALAPATVAIIYDRGTMDVASYVKPSEFQEILRRHELTYHDVRDRYDAVLHLHTAALGAEEHYTTTNNRARRETPQQARDADARTLAAWMGTPHLRIISNCGDFESKLRQVDAAVRHAVGIPVPVEYERGFEVGPVDLNAPELADAVHVAIEQVYLDVGKDGSQLRVRRRTPIGADEPLHAAAGRPSTYVLSRKLPKGPDGGRPEPERIISEREYRQLLTQADPARRPIRKRRVCFAHGAHYFELDLIDHPQRGRLHKLEVEFFQAGGDVELPPFMNVVREVTDDPDWSNAELARIA